MKYASFIFRLKKNAGFIEFSREKMNNVNFYIFLKNSLVQLKEYFKGVNQFNWLVWSGFKTLGTPYLSLFIFQFELHIHFHDAIDIV